MICKYQDDNQNLQLYDVDKLYYLLTKFNVKEDLRNGTDAPIESQYWSIILKLQDASVDGTRVLVDFLFPIKIRTYKAINDFLLPGKKIEIYDTDLSEVASLEIIDNCNNSKEIYNTVRYNK